MAEMELAPSCVVFHFYLIFTTQTYPPWAPVGTQWAPVGTQWARVGTRGHTESVTAPGIPGGVSVQPRRYSFQPTNPLA